MQKDASHSIVCNKKRLETMQENSIWETGWKENTYILKYYAAVKKNEEDFYILLWENL